MYAIPALPLQSIAHMSVHRMGHLNRYRKNIYSIMMIDQLFVQNDGKGDQRSLSGVPM